MAFRPDSDGPRPLLDRDGDGQPDLRPVRRRPERDDDDDITGMPAADQTAPPTDVSASMGDVFRAAGNYAGAMADQIGQVIGGGVQSAGQGIEAVGSRVEHIGQIIAGSDNPWQSDSSSGSDPAANDDCEDPQEQDQPANDGDTAERGGIQIDIDIDINWREDAPDGPIGGPVMVDDGEVVGGFDATARPGDPVGGDDLADPLGLDGSAWG